MSDDDTPDMERRFQELMMKDIDFGPYYWEQDTSIPWWRKCAQVGVWTAERTLLGAEFVGEIVAKVIGMDEPEFQWVMDAQPEDDDEAV